MAKIVIDAGHGGTTDPGAVYNGRREKDDNLDLALAVGDALKARGVDVVFTRTEDVYQTPFEKTRIANPENADFLISFHRNSSPEANQYTGVETLVYNMEGEKVQMAEAINQELENLGFRNIGVKERPGLVILRRSTAPALLVETGFINSDSDNELFDTKFNEIVQAITNGIMEVLNVNPEASGMADHGMGTPGAGGAGTPGPGMGGSGMPGPGMPGSGMSGPGMPAPGMSWPEDQPEEILYRVQTGAFRNQSYAQDMLYQLRQQGLPAFILRDGDWYKVQVGAFRNLDNAIKMEAMLRNMGYSTYITTV